MTLYEELNNNYPNEVRQLLEQFKKGKINENVIRRSKVKYKFKVLGRVYDDDVFTKSYKLFFDDISKIVPYETLYNLLGDTAISKTPYYRTYESIGGKFILNTDNTTARKIKFIDIVCEYLGIIKEVIEHTKGDEVFV